MKVNMTPNPLDVVTIHASQGDSEARQWEFELHNNGELIDTSKITEQLFFKAYKGGTEQLLPENGSTPTTSPFKGDIRYPQGLLTDQEFTYRQSPTEEDGLAKIESIKGNTLTWNQQMDSSQYRTGTYSSVAVTKSTDETYLVANGTASAVAYIRLFNVASVPMISGHKYCCIVPTDQDVAYYDDSSPRQYSNQYSSFIFTSNGNPIRPHARINSGVASTNRRISFMMFDLTQMGLDITDPSDFTSLFPLSYYSYNQGSLLSFMGNGIKTVGFNQWDEEWEVGTISVNTGMNVNDSTRIRSKNYIHVLGGKQYYIHGARITYLEYDANKTFLRVGNSGSFLPTADTTFTPSADASYIRFYAVTSYGTTYNHDICINISNPSKNGTYEPCTSSTLSLPISTYFPTGMKSAEDVYDELTESKAITRLKKATYSNSTGWSMRTTESGWNLFEITPSDIKHVGTPPNETIKNNRFNWNRGLTDNNTIRQVNQIISVRKDDITSLSDWNTYLASNPLEVIYELATPTETPITTASLITENAEIPLSNEDGVLIGKCTEQLSENPGFIDAKIKLADADGECYSNKIQLHVERSPQ